MREKKCFVISPIGAEGSAERDHADDVFRFIIEPAMKDFDIKPVRSDHMSESGRISEQMFREILRSDLCVVVLTGLNPNVFYELAVAQSAARPVVILIEEGHELPFDVQDLRCVIYSMRRIGRLVDGEFANMVKEHVKTFQSNGWLAEHLYEQFDATPRFNNELQVRRFLDLAAPKKLETGVDKTFSLGSNSDQRIVLVTGDITSLRELEPSVVVSLEGTNLQLARFYNNSISGTLRYLDAEKNDAGQVIRDSLQESVNHQLADLEVKLVESGTIIPTPTKELVNLNVKYIFHIAVLEGARGAGYTCNVDALSNCVPELFEKFQKLSTEHGLKSILFPVIGASAAKVRSLDILEQILPTLVSAMQDSPACQTLYLLAQLESHRDAVCRVAEKIGLELCDASDSDETSENGAPAPNQSEVGNSADASPAGASAVRPIRAGPTQR